MTTLVQLRRRGQPSTYEYDGGGRRAESSRSSGYFRDSETGLDYAKNRYHQPGMGRFLTPDPYMNSAGPGDPGSWNRYAYASGDPINGRDPSGRATCFYVDGVFDSCEEVHCGVNQFYNPETGVCEDIPGPPQNPPPQQPTQPTQSKAPSGAAFPGFAAAVNDILTKQKCASQIAQATGLTAQQLADDLNNANVTTSTDVSKGFTDYNLSPTGRLSVQWATTSGGNITLNGNYFPDNLTTTGIIPGLTPVGFMNDWLGAGSNLNATQVGTLVLLHELAHIAGGDTTKATVDSREFNQKIASLCINN